MDDFIPVRGVTYWPHAPVHKLAESGTYFVTCGTLYKQHFFRGENRLNVLHRALLSVAKEYGWQLEAWAVFSNHYHFVGHAPRDQDDAKSLKLMLSKLHMEMAKWVNKLDRKPGRKVWYNFRDSHLTFPESYFARLKYTHTNAVKHGLVSNAAEYPWCSAGWLERTATMAQVRTIYNLKIERLNVYDEFEPSDEW